MPVSPEIHFTAFAGQRRIASGNLVEIARSVRTAMDRGSEQAYLVFNNADGSILDLDLRGSAKNTEAWAKCQMVNISDPAPDHPPPARGRGRPKLGVVSREVTLLPRHWAWLGAQSGGASASLRRLVDQARKAGQQQDQRRRAQDAAYRFMSAIGGDLPGFEEAIRALFASDVKQFMLRTEAWPMDICNFARSLAAAAFTGLAGDVAAGDRAG
jgi:hypothetical protein